MLAPWRHSAVEEVDLDDLTHRLHGEFTDWYGQQPPRPDNAAWHLGLGHWPNIEDFLKDRYPAVHRGFWQGREQAGRLLDDPDLDPRASNKPYEVDDRTCAALGYDPEEIAAGVLMLHNQNNNANWVQTKGDRQRLVNIFQHRQRMQRDYEQRQKI